MMDGYRGDAISSTEEWGMMMQLEDEEIDDGETGPEDEAEIAVTDEPAANSSLRAYRHWRDRIRAWEAEYAAEKERLDRRLAQLKEKAEGRMAWHERALEAFLGDRRKVECFEGVIKRVKGRERIEVTLPETFVDWAEKSGRGALVRVKKEPDKRAIAAYVKETGELPPGTDLNRADDSFKIEV